MDTSVKQRVCGILGGLTYVSTVEYYRKMNELICKLLPSHSSCIHIVSVDFFEFNDFLNKGQYSEAAEYILEGVHQLMRNKIDLLLIASNTAHIAAPRIMECYPDLVFLHISDAVAYSIKQKNLKKIGFFGTKFSMKSNSGVVERLCQHNLDIIFPHEDDIERLHQIIIDELAKNIFSEESKQFYITSMKRLYDEQHIEGIILGCTEIPLLIKQSDFPYVPLFDSIEFHIQLAVEYQLGRFDIKSILPETVNKNNDI